MNTRAAAGSLGARGAIGTLLLAALAATDAAAQAAAADAAPAPKVAPLLGQVLGRVVGKAATDDGDGSPGLFRRLGRRLDGLPVEPGATLPEAAADALVPTLAYAMELLDPKSFAVLRPVPVGGSGALLRTGEVFVLQFSTNLPGRVRLENTDAAGQVSDLGTYTVLVDQLNRIPRDKGIQLQGRTGLETLRFYFYPCLPAEAAGRPWAADLAGRLPPCGSLPPTQVAGNQATRGLGTVTPRALVNLNQPDATMVFAGTSQFKSGDVTLLEARIRHEPPPGR